MKKSLISILLCLVLLICLMPTAVFAVPQKEPVNIISITGIEVPIAGNHPDYNAETGEGYSLDMSYGSMPVTVNGISWKQIGGGYLEVGDVNAVFRKGEVYQVELHLIAHEDRSFAADLAIAVNGEPIPEEDVYRDGERLSIYYAFPACQESLTLDLVHLFATVPEGGAHPVFHVNIDTAGCYVDETPVQMRTDGIAWYDTDGDAFLNEESRFIAGSRYAILLSLNTQPGAVFSADPIVTMNGMGAEVYRTSDTSLEVQFRFWPAKAAPGIDEVHLTLPDPKADAAVPFSVTVDTMDCSVDETPVMGRVHGIGWFDITGGRYLGEGDRFQAGHEYAIMLSLNARQGFRFSDALEVHVNGKHAEIVSLDEQYASIQYKFDTVPEASEGYDFDCGGYSSCPQFTLFSDALPYTHYAHAAIDWALVKEITNGMGDGTFGVDLSCTRGQVVTFLWRAAGKPAPKSTTNPFVDVKTTDWYYQPVLWAVEQGITKGTDATHFTPNQTCSSAHILTFLYRAVHGSGSDGWYQTARDWARTEGLLADTGLRVDPSENCPRKDVVTFLYRFYVK